MFLKEQHLLAFDSNVLQQLGCVLEKMCGDKVLQRLEEQGLNS